MTQVAIDTLDLSVWGSFTAFWGDRPACGLLRPAGRQADGMLSASNTELLI